MYALIMLCRLIADVSRYPYVADYGQIDNVGIGIRIMHEELNARELFYIIDANSYTANGIVPQYAHALFFDTHDRLAIIPSMEGEAGGPTSIDYIALDYVDGDLTSQLQSGTLFPTKFGFLNAVDTDRNELFYVTNALYDQDSGRRKIQFGISLYVADGAAVNVVKSEENIIFSLSTLAFPNIAVPVDGGIVIASPEYSSADCPLGRGWIHFAT